MQAIILAAGMGKRLKELTHDNTKCMVKVNGVTMIDRMLHQLEKYQLSRIIIVVGFKGEKLIGHIKELGIKTPIVYINNSIFDRTNNIYSLSLAKEYLKKEDTLLLESDIIFEDSVLDLLISDPRPSLALVDKYENWMDGTCVKLGKDDEIETFVPGKEFQFAEIENYYKTVNIYKFSSNFSKTHYVPFLEAYQKALGENEYYEQVLRVITMLDDYELKAKRLTGQLWYEIDDERDLDIASLLFMNDGDKQVKLLSERYGGYWRYSRLIDFCYLVNPYFPPKKLVDEIKASFETLLTQYPSGLNVNSFLAAKKFDIHPDNILVGNGAAELIKVLMTNLEGNTGIIRPTFEEYNHRYPNEKIVIYSPSNEDFSYTVSDLINYFGNKEIRNIVLINPDNPSGNYINKKELQKFIDWAKKKKITLIIDESFVDFANEQNVSLICQDILNANKHLFVVKSISKSYGVPGLRLGVLASGNQEKIAQMKKDVSIWNINSFAEFYMQIEEKYKKDYVEALEKFRLERERFIDKLSEIKELRIIPSQANYLMIEITNEITAKELVNTLFVKYNIFVKNLDNKMLEDSRQYIRIAIKAEEENDKLLNALKSIFI